MKCEICGKENDSVELVRDPYLWEIEDEEEMRQLCEDCLSDRAEEI